MLGRASRNIYVSARSCENEEGVRMHAVILLLCQCLIYRYLTHVIPLEQTAQVPSLISAETQHCEVGAVMSGAALAVSFPITEIVFRCPYFPKEQIASTTWYAAEVFGHSRLVRSGCSGSVRRPALNPLFS